MKPIMLASALCTIICTATIAGAQEESALVKQLYNGGWPDKDTVAQLNKERVYQRGIEAYMMTLPVLNVIGMRDGSEAKFGKGYNVLPVWKDRMNAKTPGAGAKL
jgi:hypothetical protein